jgi:hypothetical protein
MKNFIFALISMFVFVSLVGCEPVPASSDKVQAAQQERILKEGTAQTGMPAITNFRERKLMKDILEMRDQDGLTTFTYLVPEMTGKPVFLCESIGYGLPAATQYTNPEKLIDGNYQGEFTTIPQADPNGLFSPSSAEGTWVMCKDPNGDKVRPVYIEPRIIVSPFELEKNDVEKKGK